LVPLVRVSLHCGSVSSPAGWIILRRKVVAPDNSGCLIFLTFLRDGFNVESSIIDVAEEDPEP
jgi:hypothetical protein